MRPEQGSQTRTENLVQVAVLVFCLILFPVFIIFSSLTRLYQLKIENLRQQSSFRLVRQLEILDSVSSNRQYFHQLLKQIFNLAHKQPNKIGFLKTNIDNLRKQYPGCLEFIVWNHEGQLVKDLTDEKGYKFVLNRLFTTLKEVKEEITQDMNLRIIDLPALGKNRNLIGKYLGRFFIPEHLKLPYLNGKDAGPAKVDFSPNRSDYWYHIGSEVSFLVFFNNRILEGSDGLKKTIASINRQNSDLFTGFTKASDIYDLKARDDLTPDLKIALARFENFDRQIIETEKALIAIITGTDDLRIFAVHPKEKKLWSAEDLRNSAFIRILFLILLGYLLIYLIIYKMQVFFPISLKLTLVFLFANLIPLIVLSFIGYDYLNGKATSIRNEFINDSFAKLRKFDLGAENLLEKTRQQLVEVCDQTNELTASRSFSKDNFFRLQEVVSKVNPSEAYLVSSQAVKIFEYFPDNYKPTHSNTYVIPMMAASLKFINGNPINADTSDYFNALLSPSHSEVIRHARRNSGKIVQINTGNTMKTSFQYAFGLPGITPYNYYMMMLWDKKNISSQYLNRSFSIMQQQLQQSKLFARSTNGANFWPKKLAVPEPVQMFLEQIENSTQSIYRTITVNGKSHLAVGIKGRLLGNIVLANIVSEDILSKQIGEIRLYIYLAVVLNIFFTIAISMLLAKQLATPLYELQKATTAIGARDFKHRIPELDNDEIGYLGSIFNRVIEGLGDLEVARIVQESLFPGNSFTAGPYRIYGKSLVMTTLGGDYYDCFEIDSSRWAITIGDVAGHGVPAGLMMAMAKSGILTSSLEQKLDPTAITKALHFMFFAIKNPKMKRMMTFQYFVLNHNSGDVSFANAGHCFPLLIDIPGKSARFIEHVATPLGIGPKARYNNFDFKLEEGQALIMYTDGLAEAKNSNGEEFGYERMRQIFPELYDNDPEIFYQRIYSVYSNWAEKPDDDLTIIVCLKGGSDD